MSESGRICWLVVKSWKQKQRREKRSKTSSAPDGYLVSFLHCPRGQLPDGFLRCITKAALRDRDRGWIFTCAMNKATEKHLNQTEGALMLLEQSTVMEDDREKKIKSED